MYLFLTVVVVLAVCVTIPMAGLAWIFGRWCARLLAPYFGWY